MEELDGSKLFRPGLKLPEPLREILDGAKSCGGVQNAGEPSRDLAGGPEIPGAAESFRDRARGIFDGRRRNWTVARWADSAANLKLLQIDDGSSLKKEIQSENPLEAEAVVHRSDLNLEGIDLH